MDVFSNVEEDIGALFRNLAFLDLMSEVIIIFVPFVIIWVFDVADIMTICQTSIVIDDSAEVILR